MKSFIPSQMKSWIIVIGIVLAIQYWLVDQLDAYFLAVCVYSGINIILTVSLNLINGFTGQFSMGHAGFMAVGAYVSAILTQQVQSSHPEWLLHSAAQTVVFFFVLIIAGLSASLAGLGIGIPCLRLKGDYLAIVTLGFGEILRVLLLNFDFVGGARGFTNIPGLTNFAWVYVWVIFILFFIWRLVHSSYGRSLIAVREDETVAETIGVHITKTKILAFVISAFFAGVAGGLFAHELRYLNPQSFDYNKSFEIIIMVVLGGTGSISGSVFAAVLLTGIKEALRPLQELTKIDFRMIIYSVTLIALMLTRPRGLFGNKEINQMIVSWTRIRKLNQETEK